MGNFDKHNLDSITNKLLIIWRIKENDDYVTNNLTHSPIIK